MDREETGTGRSRKYYVHGSVGCVISSLSKFDLKLKASLLLPDFPFDCVLPRIRFFSITLSSSASLGLSLSLLLPVHNAPYQRRSFNVNAQGWSGRIMDEWMLLLNELSSSNAVFVQ